MSLFFGAIAAFIISLIEIALEPIHKKREEAERDFEEYLRLRDEYQKYKEVKKYASGLRK